MLESKHPFGRSASLRLADDIAVAQTFGDLERLRGKFLALIGLDREESSRLENALATRERELIQFYTCRI